jgi:putative Ca2+/H+ antiporter (TMEM165/GDT1 family)
MNFIAVLIGYLIPFLVYRSYVEWFAIASFLLLGGWLIYEGYEKEYKTVDQELKEYIHEQENEEDSHDAEKNAQVGKKNNTNGDNNFLPNPIEKKQDLALNSNLKEGFINGKEKKSNQSTAWILFTTIILAEFGDRSQISAVLISAAYNFYGVLIGSTLAHIVCIIIAIYMGVYLSQYLSEKQMNIFGGVLFILFAIQILYEKFTFTEEVTAATIAVASV